MHIELHCNVLRFPSPACGGDRQNKNITNYILKNHHTFKSSSPSDKDIKKRMKKKQKNMSTTISFDKHRSYNKLCLWWKCRLTTADVIMSSLAFSLDIFYDISVSLCRETWRQRGWRTVLRLPRGLSVSWQSESSEQKQILVSVTAM